MPHRRRRRLGEGRQPGDAGAADAPQRLDRERLPVGVGPVLDRGLAEPLEYGGQAVRDALSETRDYKGVSGRITFKASRDPRKPLVLLHIRNGKFRFLQKVTPE